MAEGGYDLDETGTFDTNDDYGDGERRPLIPFQKEKTPVVRTSTSTPKSSSSHHYNPSYIDETPSGRMNVREEMREEANKRIKNFFPRSNDRKFFARINDEGEVTVSLTQRTDNVRYKILDSNDDPLFDDKLVVTHNGKRKQLPKLLREALGDSVFKDITDNTEMNEGDEIELKEINEKIPNTIGKERKILVERSERLQEQINERNQENEALEERLPLRQRIKTIFKKYGFTVIAVSAAIATVIGVIVSNLKTGLAKVAKGVGNGLKELGKKLGEILPGMIGAIASFIFRTAGEVIGFLAKNAWLLIVGLVVFAVEQFKNKKK